MIITKKAIPRRTVLRGVGAALALPLLDGMVPALSALGKTAARPLRKNRRKSSPKLTFWKFASTFGRSSSAAGADTCSDLTVTC